MSNAANTLRRLNLNLLPILYELLHSKNVSEAARHLNLTQSAVSGSLRQLREIFKDELLIQRGRGMVLSEKAHRLSSEISKII
ncbi:helix-turn-helix domain-containing protein [Paraburkholderia fungorum]|uniref:helix-turn-helix domain-containing protein n=1 Tax=Paraburkholderia fungorum TaxID=134537 RepID=UPI000DB16D83|nr:MAG: hypothetical protein DI523_10695 [Paraburkholderia fungorum]